MPNRPVLEGHYASLPNGRRIHYLDEGKGPVVVLLHGSGNGACGYSNFKGNYPELVKAGYRVILPDLIGFGYSDKPDNVEYPLSFFVECVKQTLDAIG
ncbi:MAG: alpha/beta fold hydrolase, partial [Stenotrophobium sp.]